MEKEWLRKIVEQKFLLNQSRFSEHIPEPFSEGARLAGIGEIAKATFGESAASAAAAARRASVPPSGSTPPVTPQQ